MQRKSVIGGSWNLGGMAKPGPFLAVSVFTTAMVVIGGALHYGPALRAALEREWAAEIARENDEICDLLGMTSASRRSTCAEGLAQVRRRHEARLSREQIL
jgi:hypothetical protein